MSSQGLVLDTLQAACDTDAPASLMAAHMAISCAGRLRSASEEGVVVELSKPPPDPLSVGDACAVTFPMAGRSAGFTGRVLAVSKPDFEGIVLATLELPTRIQATEQRVSVRIPVPDGRLAVALLEDEQPHNVRAIDISLHGILIEFRPDDAPDLEVGHRRMLALKFEDTALLAEAEVRRRDGQRFGMFFIFRDGRPPQLTRVVVRLQQLWSDH